jgi:anti-sigma-K factor RskA
MNAHRDDVHALSGAYALDALEPEERMRFEEHLGRCSACRAEVAGLHETTALLAGTTEVAPPPSLRDSVLAGIEGVRPLPPLTRDQEPASAPERRRRWFPAAGTPLLMAAAVLAILVAAGAALWQPWQEDARTPTAAERVLQAEDARRTTVELPREATGTVVLSRSEGRAVLVAEGLPPAPEGKVYELWLQTPTGDLRPAGLLPDRADATVLLEGDASRATGFGITVEPDGGSEQPTTAPIAFVALTA